MESKSVIFEISIILVLIAANGIFAMTEMAIVSAKKARLERRAEEGDEGARVALALAEEPTQMLSTIQVGITSIGILTGTFGGASLAAVLSEKFKTVPAIAPYSYSISLFVVVASITYVSLIIGELVPKRVALNSPEPIASALAKPMRSFANFARPVVKLLSASTNAVLSAIGLKPTNEPPVTEEEIKILLEQGAEAGTFEKEESVLIDRVFRVGDLRAGAVMTPRTQMEWLDLDQPKESLLVLITEFCEAQIPAARGTLDDFAGIVYTNDILAKMLNKEEINFEQIVRPPLFIPKSMKLLKVLEAMKNSGMHVAVVLDEYGGVDGFITLHDILEELIGEMPLGSEEVDEPRIVKRDDKSWLVDGLLEADVFKSELGIDELPGEGREAYKTMGGFVTYYLGHIPTASERFEWGGFRFEIVDMDRYRVDKILVNILPAKDELSMDSTTR